MAVRGLVRRQQHFLEAALLMPVDKHQLTSRVWQSAAAATRYLDAAATR